MFPLFAATERDRRTDVVSRPAAAGSPTLTRVRLTEFWRRMDARFGPAYARSYAADQVLSTLGSRTVLQALADGDDAKDVWRAVCDATNASPSER